MKPKTLRILKLSNCLISSENISVEQLISSAQNEFPKKLFGGNCGMFAYALAKYLKNLGINAKIGIIIDDEDLEENDLTTAEFDLYHAFVDLGNKYYDGSGKINEEYLINFAEKEYGDSSPVLWDDLDINETTRKILSFNTSWYIDWTEFYNFFNSLKVAKKIITSNNDIQFVRFGGLSSVKQKGYDPKMPTLHSPPARKGIYAFVWPHIEYYLLGKSVFDPRRMEWERDEKGEKIGEEGGLFKNQKALDEHTKMLEEYWEAKEKKTKTPKELEELQEKMREFRKENTFKAKDIKPKKFKYKGNLWHHLELEVPNNEILKRKGGWVLTSFEAFKKALFKEVGRIEKLKERTGWPTSKDHLEVFIEKI